MKALSESDKLRAFITPKMKDLITSLDNSGKSNVYTDGDINLIYRYLDMIGSPKTLTTSGQSSHNFRPSYSINNYAATLQTVIADLHTRQKIIC